MGNTASNTQTIEKQTIEKQTIESLIPSYDKYAREHYLPLNLNDESSLYYSTRLDKLLFCAEMKNKNNEKLGKEALEYRCGKWRLGEKENDYQYNVFYYCFNLLDKTILNNCQKTQKCQELYYHIKNLEKVKTIEPVEIPAREPV